MKSSKLTVFRQSYWEYQGTLANDITSNAKIYEDTVKDILKLICKISNKKPRVLKVLDAGCGIGGYTFELAKHVRKVIGVEPDIHTYTIAQSIQKQKKVQNISFVHTFIEDYKSRCKFDLIISLATLEHMPEAEKSFNQIFSLLKKDGIIYLTAPNKLWLYDNHYKLPFLMWLPSPLANLYVRITGRGESFQDSSYAKTYWGIKKFFKQFPCEFWFIVPDKNALYLGCGHTNISYRIIKNLGIFLLKHLPLFWIISKGFIIVAQKRESTKVRF